MRIDQYKVTFTAFLCAISLSGCRLNDNSLYGANGNSGDGGSHGPFSLALTGNSDPTSPVADRIFDETDSPAWVLEGTCDPAEGDVTVSGDGIDSPQNVTCTASGTFSLSINYSATTPYFTSISGLSRPLTVSQGSSSVSTVLFKTTSTNPPTLVSTKAQLQAMSGAGNYILLNDIDLSEGGTVTTNNWNPIGDTLNPFKGVLEGNNKTISNLNRTSGVFNSGLFAYTRAATIKDLNLTDVVIGTTNFPLSTSYVGAIIAWDYGSGASTIENCSATGVITSADIDGFTGGLVGFGEATTIKNSVSHIDITGPSARQGGLVGALASGTVLQSYFTGTISGTSTYAGGISAYIQDSTIQDSFSVGNITADQVVGGIVGRIDGTTNTITNTYSTGDITNNNTGAGGAGPLIGNPVGTYTLNDSFYLSTAGCVNCTNSFGTGKTDTELKTQSTFTNWSFPSPWKITEGVTYPHF